MSVQAASPLVAFGRREWRRFVRSLGVLTRQSGFRRWYPVVSVSVLLGGTLFWSVLGARVQVHNADQLSDAYLFSSWATFHGASFPAAHTFLLKWPIFALLGLVGTTPVSLLIATVAVSLLTVGALALVLYKIDRRPIVFGTVCLALTLALLLVPAQPYTGGILPVNMAMLTTRNLEYVAYVGVLVLFATARRLRSRRFIAGAVLLALLIASDRLFLSLSLGGALLALLLYALLSNWSMTAFAVRWLAGGIMAGIGSGLLLLVISATHLTHLAGDTTGPYGIVVGGKSLVLGTSYALLGFLTNSGANPVYDNTVLGDLPAAVLHRLGSLGSVAYLVAAGVLLYALVSVIRLARATLAAAPRRRKVPAANLLALALVWSTVAAFGAFVATNHYYAVDARYLAVGVFALAIGTGVWMRKLRWPWPEDLLLIAGLLLPAIALAAVTALRVSNSQVAAYGTVTARNSVVTAALQRHKVDVLVGDYWRVLPIKLASHGKLNVTPLGACTQPVASLTSTVWQPDLAKRRFAYLVTLDGSLTGFPHCSLAQVTAAYGRPNATQIIAGSSANPTEVLLFYDAGSHPSPALAHESPAASAVLPVPLDQLTKTDCAAPTIMNVVAHQDDDLLFLSPDLLHEIQAGDCIRTVFLTAGDSGLGKLYWLSRQLGSEAAYSKMLGTQDIWDQQTVMLNSHAYITVATPHNSSQVSLIFLNLPDGNLNGKGFSATHDESLAKLYGRIIPRLHTVDNQSSYTGDQLVAALTGLMNAYQPAEIHTQADVADGTFPDHSDHIATGKFAADAAVQYDHQHFGDAVTIPVTRYIGYPIQGYDPNVSDQDLQQKADAFFAYGQFDGGVCRSIIACDEMTYGSYLQRQYQQTDDN